MVQKIGFEITSENNSVQSPGKRHYAKNFNSVVVFKKKQILPVIKKLFLWTL